MSEIITLDELLVRREELLNEVDSILDTAQEAERSVLLDDERSRHDAAVTELETLDEQITAAELERADQARFAERSNRRKFTAPNINLGAPSIKGDRSLDELQAVTRETVRAGSFTQSGRFIADRNGAVNDVEPLQVERAGVYMNAPRYADFAPEHGRVIERFQQQVSDMVLFGHLTSKGDVSTEEAFDIARSNSRLDDNYREVLRAMDVDTAAEGGTWVPTGIGATLHEKVRAAGKIAPLFARVNIPTNPWKWPVEGADAAAYRVAEPTGDTESKPAASTPGTVAATFDAEIFGGRVLTSRSLEADSAIAILPFITGKLAQAFVDTEEKAILDGDTDGTHQDTDTQAAGATHGSSAWDGLRKRALANAAVDGAGAPTVAKLRAVRALMGKWGLDPMQTVYITGPRSYYQLLADTEVTSVEKYGSAATILNGELGRVNGSPLIVSEHVRENLNATGVHDGVTTTKSYLLAVNRGEWAIGQREGLAVETDDSIYRETYQRVLVGFMREDFQNIGDASTNDDTAISYNIS
jgi:predicted phage gp36 major capsid-like protein